MPKATASADVEDQEPGDLLVIEGSWGRRPMMKTSKSSRPAVRAMVTTQTRVETPLTQLLRLRGR